MTPSMTTSRVGDVVSVEFPFTDMQGRKRRPGVVLAGDASDLLASLDVRLIHHTIGTVSAGDRTKLAQAIERMALQIAQAMR